MKIEIEAKVRADDLTVVVARLQELDAEHVGGMREVNIFLDSAERRLNTADRGLRVRTIDHADGRRGTAVTYKGPRKPGKLKARREIEFAVDDVDATIALFAELGYREVIRFEKRRTRYRLDGCVIELDRLPYLGTFVEIEGPGDKAVVAAQLKLGLGEHPLIKSSYVAMLGTYLDEHGIAERDIRLEPPAE